MSTLLASIAVGSVAFTAALADISAHLGHVLGALR